MSMKRPVEGIEVVAGLKIPWAKARVGSSPTRPTSLSQRSIVYNFQCKQEVGKQLSRETAGEAMTT